MIMIIIIIIHPIQYMHKSRDNSFLECFVPGKRKTKQQKILGILYF